MDFTKVTKNVGGFLANLISHNELLDELNTVYNPTFIEILDDVKDSDQTLGSLLIYWYMNKYGINEDRLNNSMKYLRASLSGEKKEEEPKVIYKYIEDDGYNYTCGGSSKKYTSPSCSSDDDYYDYSCGGLRNAKGYSKRDDRC